MRTVGIVHNGPSDRASHMMKRAWLPPSYVLPFPPRQGTVPQFRGASHSRPGLERCGSAQSSTTSLCTDHRSFAMHSRNTGARSTHSASFAANVTLRLGLGGFGWSVQSNSLSIIMSLIYRNLNCMLCRQHRAGLLRHATAAPARALAGSQAQLTDHCLQDRFRCQRAPNFPQSGLPIFPR